MRFQSRGGTWAAEVAWDPASPPLPRRSCQGRLCLGRKHLTPTIEFLSQISHLVCLGHDRIERKFPGLPPEFQGQQRAR